MEQHIIEWWNRRSKKWNRVFQKMEQVTECLEVLFDWQMPSPTKKQKFIWQKEKAG